MQTMEKHEKPSNGKEPMKDEADDGDPLELVLFQVPECYVYIIPPRKSAASYRADEWDVNKWAWEGVLKVISKGEECIIRLEDKSTGELYAQAYLRKGELHPVEPVADSSRYFVLRVEENTGGRLRHAFIGIGFREKPQAYDFEAALHDHMKYLEKKKTAEEMEQQFQSSSSVDYSFKDGETLVLHLKDKAGKNLVRSRSSEKGGLELSPTKKGSPKESLLSIKPPPPPPSTLPPTTVSPSYSSLRSKQEISPHSISTENQSEINAPDDDFGDFQTAD